jgi:hypothetical protein
MYSLHKNPVTLYIIDTDLSSDNPFPLGQKILFPGIPESVRRTVGASDIAMDTPDTLDDIFDIGKLKGDVPVTPAKPAKPAKSAKESRTPEESKTPRERTSEIFLFPEDRISEFKEKIFVETGIPPYKQYLCINVNDNYIPMYYRIIANGMINVDIQKSLSIVTKIMGIPVDTNFFHEKDQVLVEASDMFFTLHDVQNTFHTPALVFYLFNIDTIFSRYVRVMYEMVRTEPDQIELLYYGFVLKYWPMITYDIFLQYLSNDSLIPKSYPDIAPNKDKLRERIRSESAILNEKYKLLSSNSSAMSLYSPQVANFDKPTSGSIIDTSIKSATMIVKEKSWNSDRVGLEFSGRTKMNIRNLFYHMHVSKEIPIIRARLMISNQIITITKIQSPTFNKGPNNINQIYDQMRMRIHVPYFNAVMFVVRLGGAGTPKFVTVTIRDTGRYEIKSIWNEDDKMNFKVLIQSISSVVNPFIKNINNMGRTVFHGGMTLSYIQETTVTFSDLNMALFWKKSINSNEFQIIIDNLKKRSESEIIKFTESPESMTGLIHYVLIKGMTQESLAGAYKNLQTSNYYEYLSSAKIKQKWYQLFAVGRDVIITHRTVDVKIDVENLKEKEFKYFYDHVVTLLFESERDQRELKHARNPRGTKRIPNTGLAKAGKNLLKVLKGRDPELFNFKRYGIDVVYSRKCQKDHQPIPYSTEEYETLGAETKKRAVKYWNFTSETPMYYVCPNSNFPHMSFIVGQHPKNYCLPCCKKTPLLIPATDHPDRPDIGDTRDTGDTGDTGDADTRSTKKENIYDICLQNHCYSEDDVAGASRYIMNYGKVIDVGRVGKLPDIIDKWILYNMKEDILVRSQPDSTVRFSDREYSVNKMWKITKNNKTRLVPVSVLLPQLEQKSWSARDDKYSPKEIMEKHSLSPDHYNRTLNVDTNYPIIVYRNIYEGWQVILDGLHRLAKIAYLSGTPPASALPAMVTVKYITHNQLAKTLLPQGKEIKNVGKKLMAKKVLKKPGYYLYGTTQNSAFVNNVGAGYAIAMSLGKTMAQFVRDIVHTIKESNIYLSLLEGHIIKHFKNKGELIKSLLLLFGDSNSFPEGTISGKFDKWNELFIDLTRLCFNIYVIVLEDTGSSINLNIPIKINSVDNIFPQRTDINSEADIAIEYIFLFKRDKKSRTLYNVGNLYYPIFVITPQEFFKSMNIDKRLYNQNDEIVNMARAIVEQMLGTAGVREGVRDMNIQTILAFVDGSAGYALSSLYVDTKGVCYAVGLQTTEGVSKVIIPIKYSFIDNIPDKHFIKGKKNIIYVPIASFTGNDNKSMKEFIMKYNAFASTSAGSYPLIKIEELLVRHVDRVMGFVSNGLRYYIVETTRAEFFKYMRSYVADDIGGIDNVGTYYVRYDPTIMNKIIYSHQHASASTGSKDRDARDARDHNMNDIPRIIYEKHMYYLYTSEFMAYIDQERNTAMRKKIMNIISSDDLRGRLESIQRSLQAILLPDYPEDMTRIEEILSQYYTSHYDRKTLMHEVSSVSYQFDRITLTQLRDVSDHFHGQNKQQKEFKMKEIQNIVKDVSDHFVTKKTPTFGNTGGPGVPGVLDIVECKSNLGKSVPYCEKGKLLIPAKKLQSFIEIFSEEIVNPLRREYILSAVYMSEIIDMYKFPKYPGEELYIKYG